MPPQPMPGPPPNDFRYPFSFFPGRPSGPSFGSLPPLARGFAPVPRSLPPSPGGLQGMIASLMPGGASGGGGMNLIGTLMNAQKAIKTAQTILPVVQQLAPLIKNAPAILSVLNSLKDVDLTAAESNEEQVETDGKDKSPVEPDNESSKQHSLKNGNKNERFSTSGGARKKNQDRSSSSEKSVHVKQNKATVGWDSIEACETRPSQPKLYI